ncbi:hypothetical protein RGQ29_014681 [Quercus rubra]|uniref:Bet v I/Major latex protein domain-containing protein n=1 Tax=Quercus rubra TaxID=3512 RepID=A0AAN7FV09_QUERU|nr:hypothetical protein RGQ29_014681 [Quercus rubra]
MALKYKLGTEVEIKSPPEKYYNIFKGQAFHVPNAAPDHIQGVDVHEGDWETHGSVKIWKYTMEGKSEFSKRRLNMMTKIGQQPYWY